MMRMRDDEASSEMSEITVDSAEAVGDRGGPTSSDLDHVAFDPKRTKWTNEKHCLYLKAMEASFVSELHCSMGLCKGTLENKSSAQFKKFRDGSWKNVSLYDFGTEEESHVNLDDEIESKMNPFLGLDSNSKQLVTTRSNLYRQDSVDSNIEESGQNFDNKDEVMGSKSMRRVKRKRTETASNSMEDQVVPFKDYSTAKAPNDIALNQ